MCASSASAACCPCASRWVLTFVCAAVGPCLAAVGHQLPEAMCVAAPAAVQTCPPQLGLASCPGSRLTSALVAACGVASRGVPCCAVPQVPPVLNQFVTRALDKNQAETLFKLLLKYRCARLCVSHGGSIVSTGAKPPTQLHKQQQLAAAAGSSSGQQQEHWCRVTTGDGVCNCHQHSRTGSSSSTRQQQQRHCCRAGPQQGTGCVGATPPEPPSVHRQAMQCRGCWPVCGSGSADLVVAATPRCCQGLLPTSLLLLLLLLFGCACLCVCLQA